MERSETAAVRLARQQSKMTFTTYLKSIRGVAYLLPAARILRRFPAATINRVRRLFTRSRLAGYDRLHLGSGLRQMRGWANIDMFGARNIIWDLRSPLPVRARQIRFVYTEHFIEHIERSDCLVLLRSVRRSMDGGAVLRISTPDLRVAARNYLRRQACSSSAWAVVPANPLPDAQRGHEAVGPHVPVRRRRIDRFAARSGLRRGSSSPARRQ